MVVQNQTLVKSDWPRWAIPFIEALRLTGNVSEACRCAEIKSRPDAYELRKKDPDFARLWEEAYQESIELLELEARRRAYHGWEEPVIYQGELSGVWVDPEGHPVNKDTPGARQIPLTVKKYDTTLLIFLLKGAMPEKYRDNHRLVMEGGAKPLQVQAVAGDLSRLTAEELEVYERLHAKVSATDPPGSDPVRALPP